MLMWIRSCVSMDIGLGLHLIVGAHTCKRESIFHAFTRCTNPQTGVTLPAHIYTGNAWQKKLCMHFFWALLNAKKLSGGAAQDLLTTQTYTPSLQPGCSLLSVHLQPTCSLACFSSTHKKIKCEQTDDLPHLHWNILAEICPCYNSNN